MMASHTLDGVTDDRALEVLLRRALRESGLTQSAAALRIGRSQTWFPNSLFREPSRTIRYMFVNEPETLDDLMTLLGVSRSEVLALAGITAPASNAAEIPLSRPVPVFTAGAGPALDEAEAVDLALLPSNNGGSYRVIGLKIHGSSMSPYLDQGDIAFIACEPALVKPGRAIGLHIPDIGSVVKILVRIEDDGELLLQSLNPNGADDGQFFTAPADARIYGPVIHRLKKD